MPRKVLVYAYYHYVVFDRILSDVAVGWVGAAHEEDDFLWSDSGEIKPGWVEGHLTRVDVFGKPSFCSTFTVKLSTSNI